jgi:hypothetical protein
MKRIVTVVCVLTLSAGTTATTGFAAQQGKQGGQRSFESDRRSPKVGFERGPEREIRDQKMKDVKAAEQRERKMDRFEDRMQRNPALRAKLERMLPAGTNLSDAATGFRNQGQFIAALHASKNLGIPFDELKAKMTGPKSIPLGQSVRELRPNLSENEASREAERAQNQAIETEKR